MPATIDFERESQIHFELEEQPSIQFEPAEFAQADEQAEIERTAGAKAPQWAQNAAEAVKNVASGFIPRSFSDAAHLLTPVVGGIEEAKKTYEIARDVVGGASIEDATRKHAPEQFEIVDAEKTPALSKERFQVGLGIATQMLMGAGIVKGMAVKEPVRPAIESEAIPKVEEPPLAPSDNPAMARFQEEAQISGIKEADVNAGSASKAAKEADPVIAAAYRDSSGKVFTGRIHDEAIQKAQDSGALMEDGESGFVTKSGKFLDDMDAYEHAVEQKQIQESMSPEAEFVRPELEASSMNFLEPEQAPSVPRAPEANPAPSIPKESILPTSTKNAITNAERESRGVSKIGQSIEAKAVEAKLTQGFAETAGFDPISIADQAYKATSFVKASPVQARAVIRGEAPLPEGLRGTSLITAMEEQLTRHPSAEVAYELANSPLTSATSVAAQEMRLMAERVPDGITATFHAIREARKAGSEQRGQTVERVVQSVRNEIVKNSSKRPTWEAFARSLECV